MMVFQYIVSILVSGRRGGGFFSRGGLGGRFMDSKGFTPIDQLATDAATAMFGMDDEVDEDLIAKAPG